MTTVQQERSAIERHAHTVALAIILGMLGWLGKTWVSIDTRMAVIESRLQTFAEDRQAYYPAALALQRWAEIERRIDRLERTSREEGQ